MNRIIVFFLPLLFVANSALAAEIRGTVANGITNEMLLGATVYIKELKMGVVSGFDGSYVLSGIPKGNYSISVRYVGFIGIEQSVFIISETTKMTIAFSLQPDNGALSEITVIAHVDNSTDNSARSSEKNASNIINVMSAKSIELSPDLNIAQVVGRMSGVTLERNSSGEGQYAILRGMDKRYNYTLVNGVKISSPDNKNRYIPLDIFPAELVDRIEVTKSLTANMEGDATGGVINLVMKDAPNQFTFQVNGAMGYNSNFLDRRFTSYPVDKIIQTSPREKYGKSYAATMSDFGTSSGKLIYKNTVPNGTAGLVVGNRLWNQKIGFIVAGNFQNIYKGAQSTFFEDEMLQTEKNVRLTSMKKRTYSENQKQLGIHFKADYKLSATDKLELYAVYINMKNAQVRQSNSTNFKLNYDPENGDGDFLYQTRIRTTQQNILASILQGKYTIFSKVFLQWSVSYSKAQNKTPENTEINIDNLRQDSVDNIYADADGSTRRWEHNADRDLSGSFSLRYEIPMNNASLNLEAGGYYRNKERSNSYVNYYFKPLGGNQQYGTDYTTFDQIQWTVYTPYGSVGPLQYDAHEYITAGYVQAQLKMHKGYVIAGLRAENTNQGYFQYFPDDDSNPSGNQVYLDLLPSVHFKYSPANNINWRASYFRSINRPGFFEIVPYQITNEEYSEFGNSSLQRAVIDNIDLRWEYFMKSTQQIMVGMFYKNIKNPIEYAYFTTNYRQYGYGPVNLGDAVNYGMEIDVIKYIRNWGIRANYTYTHSSITTSKAYYGTDENGNYKRFFQNQTRPLVGLVAHVANVSLMYKNTRNKWDAQLAAAYTGDKIVIASHYLHSDYWQAGATQLDASAEKQFKHGISVFTKINNIINAPRQVYIKNTNVYNEQFPMQGNDNTLIQKDFYGRTFLIGLRIKL